MTDVVHLIEGTGHGGDALAALSLAAAQRARGMSVVVLILASDESARFVERASARGVPAYELRDVRHDGGGASGWRRVGVVRRSIREHRPRIVHVHTGELMTNLADCLGVLAAGVPGRVATVQSPFGWERYPTPERYQRRWRLAARAFGVVTAPSEGACRQQLLAGLPRRRVRAVPNAVETAPAGPDRRAAVRSELQAGADEYLVLFVGRLASEKGVVDVVHGFAPLARREPRARLIVVGAGDLADAVVSAAVAEQVDRRVTMLGYRTDTADLFAAADAVANPSLSESFGNTIVEAMAAGLPVVATNVGVVTSFDAADAPIAVVPPGDPGAIAAALIGFRDDPAGACALGDRARDAARAFSPEAVAAEFDAVYDQVTR